MNLVPYKNKYGFMRVDCPFCTYDAKFYKNSETTPDALRDLKRHITNQAKTEALELYLAPEKSHVISHLAYYKSHTSHVATFTLKKRRFDNDLTTK